MDDPVTNVAETLVVDKQRAYSEQERDCATAIQGAVRGLHQRRTFHKLQTTDNPKQGVTFANAVRESSRIAVNVGGADPEVESATQAPVGALLAMYTFHETYKGHAFSHLWSLWKCFWAQSLFDLPLGILAHLALLWFSAVVFYAPMWGSLTVRFIFYDGEGQVEIEKFFKWLLICIFCATSIWAVSATCFVLLQERFGNRMKWRITIVAAEYGKLITKEEVDLMRGEYLSSMKTIFFHLLPQGMACLLILLASWNFLFIRSHLIGGLSVAVMAFSAIFLAVYDSFVSSCSKAFEESRETESEFWAHLASSNKDVALGEIVALSKATSLYSFKSNFFHIAMGGAYRLVLIFSPISLVYLGTLQIVSKDIQQFELLFCFFYFITTLACMLWLNKATVEFLKHLGGAFRLAHFIHGTVDCIPRRRIRHSSHTLKYGVVRIRDSMNRAPWGVIMLTMLLLTGAIGTFVQLALTSEASLSCRPADVHCKLIDGTMHKIQVSQHFDMDSGCSFDKNNDEIAEQCLQDAPLEARLKQQHSCVIASAQEDSVAFTYTTGQNRTNGVTIREICEKMDLCQDVKCGQIDDCHLAGECQHGVCNHPVAADGIACTLSGRKGACHVGVCKHPHPHDGARRLSSDGHQDAQTVKDVLSKRRVLMTQHRKNLQQVLQANNERRLQDCNKGSTYHQYHTTDVGTASTFSYCITEDIIAPTRSNCELRDLNRNVVCKISCTDETALNYNALADASLPTFGESGNNAHWCCYGNLFVTVPQELVGGEVFMNDPLNRGLVQVDGEWHKPNKVMEVGNKDVGYCIYQHDCLVLDSESQDVRKRAGTVDISWTKYDDKFFYGDLDACNELLVHLHTETAKADQSSGNNWCFKTELEASAADAQFLFTTGIARLRLVAPDPSGMSVENDAIDLLLDRDICVPWGNLFPELPQEDRARCPALAIGMQLQLDLPRLAQALVDGSAPSSFRKGRATLPIKVSYTATTAEAGEFLLNLPNPANPEEAFHFAIPKVWKMSLYDQMQYNMQVQSVRVFNPDIYHAGWNGATTDFNRCNFYQCYGVYTHGASVASGYLEDPLLGKFGLGGQLWSCDDSVLARVEFKAFFDNIMAADPSACAGTAFRNAHWGVWNTYDIVLDPGTYDKWVTPKPLNLCNAPVIMRAPTGNGDASASFGFDFGSFATGFDFTSRKLSGAAGSFGFDHWGERRLEETIELVDSVLDTSPTLAGRRTSLEAWDDLLHMDIGEVSDVFDELRDELESGDSASRMVRKLAEEAGMDDKQMVWKVPYGAAEGHMEYGLYGKAAPDAFGAEAVKVAADETAFDHAQDAEFVAGADLYDNTIMQAFHNMPAIAYCANDAIAQWDCPLCRKQAGISDVKVVQDDDGDAKAFVAAATHAGKPVVQVVFYGSMQADLLHWAQDAELVAFPGCEKCKVNKAFTEDYTDLSTTLRAALTEVLAKHPGASVQLLGQGFGGALVPFAALDLVGDFPVSAAITLGKPRVGNVHFADFYQASKAGAVSFRLVHWRDPLPHVPPMEMGFIHESQEIWYDAASANYRVCAGVEHPDCSDSVYVFNVTDHLSFFGGDLLRSTMACAGDDNSMAKAMHGANNAQKLMSAASSPIQAAETLAAQSALPDFMQDLFKTAGFSQDSEPDAAKLNALSFTSPATAGFDESAAREAESIAEAQWCNADNLNEFLEGKKMQDVHVIAADEATAVLAVVGDRLVVSFKGGVVTNLAATQKAAFCADCKVSSIIEAKYNSVRAAAADALAKMRVDWPKAQVTVTGMGEGGAMAVLFALESAKDASVLTFGAPRVGNPAFARFYEASGLSARTFRVVHWRDPVPHMPASAEFEHVGVEIFYNQDSSAFRACSADVACANEAVTVFNFLDHFTYFGKDTMQCMIGDALDKKGRLTLAGAVLMTLREQGSALLTAPGTPVPAGLKDLLNVNKLFDAAPSTDAAMRRPGFDLPKESGFPHEQATPSAVGTLHNFYPNNFDHSLVAELAHLPYVAFCEKEKVEAWACGALCDRNKETTQVKYIADEDPSKAAAVVAVNHNAQILVLYKAGLPVNGLSDFEFISVSSMCEDCKVNRGLYSQYLLIRSKVMQEVHTIQQTMHADITVMGWSFGGALATYGALDLVAAKMPVKMVLTMGMPRAGNGAFVDHYHSTSLQHITWRITHWEDPMTHLPPTTAGWRHVGTEVWYNEDFSRFRICDGSGEDNYCAASKPGFKLNADHFTYFGLDYASSATQCGALTGFESSLKNSLPVLGEAMGWMTPLMLA